MITLAKINKENQTAKDNDQENQRIVAPAMNSRMPQRAVPQHKRKRYLLQGKR